MFSTNTFLFLFLLLILPYRIIADDSSSFKLQDLTYPIASSDADSLQPVIDLGLNPETLLTGSENNVVAECQSPSPNARTRRSRLRKRQTDFCSWNPFKSGAPPTTDKPGVTGHGGAHTSHVPTVKIGPTDVNTPDEEKDPVLIPFGASKRPEVCKTSEAAIPVCHYLPGSRGSSRWLSPILVLTPIRLYGPGEICMGLEETWCCSSTSARPNEHFDSFYPAVAMLYPMTGQQCIFITGPIMGRGG